MVYAIYVSRCKVGFLTTLQVLLGFAANTILTFGAIILGYLTRSLPEDDLTDFDRKMLARGLVERPQKLGKPSLAFLEGVYYSDRPTRRTT